MSEILYGRDYASAQSRDIPRSHLRLIRGYFPLASDDRVLELGVGNGSLLPTLRAQTPHVYGIDINTSLVTQFGDPSVVHGDATDIPFPDSSFNKIISLHTLEHIPDLPAVFSETDRVTTPQAISLHIFPKHLLTKAEGAIKDAIRMYPHQPVKAWRLAHELHVHRLNPKKIEEMIEGTNWRLREAKWFFIPESKGTNWMVVLEK